MNVKGSVKVKCFVSANHCLICVCVCSKVMMSNSWHHNIWEANLFTTKSISRLWLNLILSEVEYRSLSTQLSWIQCTDDLLPFYHRAKNGLLYINIYIKLDTTAVVFVNYSNSDVRDGLICSLANITLSLFSWEFRSVFYYSTLPDLGELVCCICCQKAFSPHSAWPQQNHWYR